MPSDPTLYLYTSLTAGSSHIITATSRIETILKANKIPFKALDCATDDKARMLWARRSKGRKIPGLVKFGDVIADLEQVEEWNEHGELEDQIEDQIDIFGDVPVSATTAEAHAAAAARAQAQEEARKSAASGAGRTASETRHISISEPTDDKRKASTSSATIPGQEKQDSPLSMAMRQAGAEAAAKAGQKKSTATTTKPSSTPAVKAQTSTPVPSPAVVAAAKAPTLDSEVAEPTAETTVAKTPEQLSAEGAKKTSIDKLNAPDPTEEGSTKSNEAQIIDQRRKSSVPAASSSLAQTTSIDESHTVATDAKSVTKPGSASKTNTKKIEEEDDSEEDDDDDDDEDEDEDEDDSDEEEDDDDSDEEEEEERPTKAAKVSATDKEENKVLKGTKPQQGSAKDANKAGVSVAD